MLIPGAVIDESFRVTESIAESESTAAKFGALALCNAQACSRDDASAHLVRTYLARFQLLVFRDQTLSPAEQIKFTCLFGEPEPSLSLRPNDHKVADFPGVLRLHNRPGSPTLDYGQSWHSDGLAYARTPHGATILSCKACPDGVGDTLFSSQVLAYQAMPEDLRREIERLSWLLPPMPFSEVPDGKALVHPLVRTHPLSGQKFIFCAPNAQRILGMDIDQSTKLLARVRGYQLAASYQYRHRWRPGDLVVWDNCGLLHNRADIITYERHGLREMHRTATAGTFAATEIAWA